MRVVNRRRFIIACMVFGFLLGLTGYGLYRGVVIVWEMVMTKTVNEQAEGIIQEEGEDRGESIEETSSSIDPFLNDLTGMSRWVLGCSQEVQWENGVASLMFEVNPELSLNYYPEQEVSTRLLKQTLKLLQDLSKIEGVEQIQQLELSYLDQRFIDAENSTGQVLAFSFEGNFLHETNWENETWQSLNEMSTGQ